MAQPASTRPPHLRSEYTGIQQRAGSTGKLPLTSQMLGVDLDGSRRIQTDRLEREA
jgi:hypothetical protein